MNASKPLTFAAALLISTAGVAGIRAYANALTRSVLPAPVSVGTPAIQTLPAITVRPTRAQIEAVRGHIAKGTDSAVVIGSDFGMPYYSFAAKPAVGSR